MSWRAADLLGSTMQHLREPGSEGGHVAVRILGAVGGAGVALLAAAEGVHLAWYVAGVALLAMLAAFTAEIVSSYAISTKKQRGEYDWDGKILRKVLRIIMVALAAGGDAVLYAVAHYLPHRYALLEYGFLFFAIMTMLWYFIGDFRKTVDNVSKEHPEDAVPVLVQGLELAQTILRSVNITDLFRLRKRTGDPTAEASRWSDYIVNMPAEELAVLLEKISAHPDEPLPVEELNNPEKDENEIK